MGTIARGLAIALTGCAAAGCSSGGAEPARLLPTTQTTTQPATQPISLDDPVRSEPWFWLDQPAVASVEFPDFHELWEASRAIARHFLYEIDREDFRGGLMTTSPQVSPQVFEPWRRDVGTINGLVLSSLATVRRTIHFRFERADDGTYRVTPKVLVERLARAERRITTPVQYREAFSGNPPGHTRESDLGLDIPSSYWYAIGRDEAMEKRIAEAVRSRVN